MRPVFLVVEASLIFGVRDSFPSGKRTEDRGATQGYRGNCSGYVYREIFEVLHPRVFTDPWSAAAPSGAVAREMGIEAHGLDLHSGFNILKQRILEVVGKPSDLVCFRYCGLGQGRAPRRSVALRPDGSYLGELHNDSRLIPRLSKKGSS